MEFNELIAELRAASENLPNDSADRSLLSSLYCNKACKAIDRISEDLEYNNVITGLWLVVAHFAEQLAYLKPVPALSELCFKLFRQCAKSVLNIQWQNLEEDSSVRQNFLVSLANLHTKLIPFDFPRFRLLEALTENPWTNPTLAKVMGGEVEDGDKEEVRNYIEQEDPIILQLRVDMMLRENCEEYALNLCNSCLTHPELQTDLSIRKIQLSLLYKLGHEDRLQEECQKLSIQDALRIIKQLQTSQPHRQLCTVLAQTFMVQNWIRPSDMEANKELLRLWIRQQLLVDREQDQFKESVWAMAKLSQSTDQIVIFIDVLREECGDVYLQLYVDMCIFAINVDKGQMETNIKEGNMDAAIARRSDMASICAKLSCLCHHTSLKVARICALTSFTLRPSEQSFTKIGTFYGQAGGCCNKCGLEKNHEPGKVNPATLYEVERLLNMLRPDYLNPENSFSNIQALCRRFLHESVKNAQMRNQQVASGVSILSVTQIEGPGKKKIMPQANKPNNLFEALTPQDIQNTQSLLNKMRLQSMPPPKPTHLVQNTPRLMNPSGSMRPNIIQNNQQMTAFKPGPQNKQQYMFDAEKVKSSIPFGVTLEQQQYYALKREKELELKQKYAQKRVEKPQDSLGTNIQISQQQSSVMLQNQMKQKQLLQRNARVSQMIQSAMRQDSNVLQSPDIVQAVLNIMKGNVLKQTSPVPQQQTLNHQMPQTSSSTAQQGTQPLPTVSTLLRPTIHSQQLGQPQQSGQPQQHREQPSPRKYPRPQLYAQPIIVSTSPSLTSLSNRSHITTAQISRNSNLHNINVISTMSSAQRQGAENQMSKSQADSIRQYMQMSNIQKQIAEQRQMSGSTVTLNNIPVTRSPSIHQINVGAISRPKTTVELAEQASLAKQQEKLANYQQQVRTNQAQGYSHTNQRLPKNNQQQFLASAPNQQILMSQKHLQQQNNSFNVNNCHQSSSLTHNQALPLPPSDELSGSITGIDDTIIKELLQDSGILANTFPDIEVDNIGEDKSRKISEQALTSSQHNLSLQTLDPIRRTYSDSFQPGVQFPKYSLASSVATSQSTSRTNQPLHISNTSQISHASVQQSNTLITKSPNMVAPNQQVNTKVSQQYVDNAQNRLQRAFNQQQFSMKPTVSPLQRDTVSGHVASQPEQKPTMDQLREIMKKEDIEGEICMDSANNATYRCIICSSAFETLDALREHVRNVCKPGLQSSSVYNSKIKQDRANSAKAGVETTTVFQCLRCFELCVSDVGIKQHRLTCKRVPTVPSDLKKDAANKNRPSPKPSRPLTPKKEPRDNLNVAPELPLSFPYPTLNAGATLKSSEINSAGKQLLCVSNSNVNVQQPPTSYNISYPQTCVTLANSGSQSLVVATSYNSTPPGGTYNPKSSHQSHVQTNNHENQASLYNFAHNVSRSNTPTVITGANINNVNMFNVKTGTGAPVASHVVVNLDQSTLPAVNKEIVNKSAQVPDLSTVSVSSVTLSSASTVSNMPLTSGALLPVGKETVSSSQTPNVLVPQQLKEEQGPSKKVKEKLLKPKVKKLPPPSFSEISGSGGCKFYKCDLCSQTLCSLESFVIHWEICATKNKSLLRRRASREKLLNAKPMTGEILQNVLSVISNVAAGSGPLEVQLADNESDADSRLVSLLDPCTTDHDLVESNEMDNTSWVEDESPNNVPDERDSICHEGSEEEKDVFSEVSSEKDSVDDSVEYKRRRCKYVESDEDDDDNSLSESDQNLAFVSTRDAPPKLRDRKTLKPIHSFINETFLSPYYKGNAKSDGDRLGEDEEDGEEKTPSPTSDEVDSEGDGLSCTVCRTTYQTKRMLLQHCAGKHLKPYTVKTLADSSSYFCHLCQKTFSTFMHFMQHVPNHSVTIYEKMKSYAANRKLLQHSQRIATQRGFMKKGGMSPKMAKALKSKKAAKKSAVDKLKRELLSSSTHSVRETLRLSKRKRSLCQKFTSSEEDYSTDASNTAVTRSKRAESESSLLRGISLRGRGRPRKQSSVEEASSTEDSGPKLAKSPDHDYVASDDAYDSDISLERAPPITRSRKRSNQTAFHSSISKRNSVSSFSEDLSEINGDDSESGTGSRLGYKKIVSEAGVIEFDSDSNSATLTFVQHNNGSLIPVSDTESPEINTSQGGESIIPELNEIKNPPRKITVGSLSRRLKEKLKSCDLHPTIVLEALTSKNIDASTGDCKSKEPKSESTVSYKCSFLDSFLSYLNHYPNATDNKNTKSSHFQRRSGPTEQRKRHNFDDKSLSVEISGDSPVIRSRGSSVDGSVTSTDPGSLADTEGSTISYSTGSEKESSMHSLQRETSSSGDMKSFLAKFPTRRCSVNLGRKINADSLCLNTCTNLSVDKSIDLESPAVKEKVLDDTRKKVKVPLESSGGAIIRPVEPVVRLRRISVPVGDCSQTDLPEIVNTKNVGKGKEEQITKNSNHDGAGPAECDNDLKSHCMRSKSAEHKYYCSALWHEQNTKKISQTDICLKLKCSGVSFDTIENSLNEDIQAVGDYLTKDKTQRTGNTTPEPDTLSVINAKSSNDGSLTGSLNIGSDCAKNIHSNGANDCVYVQNIPKFPETGDEKNVIIERNYDDDEECMEPSGESDDFYIVKESSDHELDDSELSEEEPNVSSDKEPNNSSEKEPKNSTEKEPKNSNEKEPKNIGEKELNNSSKKEPNNSSEREPNNSFKKDLNISGEKEPNNRGEKEPSNKSNSSEREPNNSFKKDLNISGEKEPNNRGEKEPSNKSEKEPNNRSDKEPNNSSETEPKNIRKKEPNNSGEKELNNSGKKEPDNSNVKELNNSGDKEPNKSSDKEPNNSSEKEPNNSSEKEPNKSSDKEPNKSIDKEPNNSSEKKPNNRSDIEPNNSSENEPNASSEKEHNNSDDKEHTAGIDKEPNASSEKELNNSSDKEPKGSSDKEPNASSDKEPYISSEKADLEDKTQNTSIFETSGSIGNGENSLNQLHAKDHLEFKQTIQQDKKEQLDNNDAHQTFPDNFDDSLHITSHSEKDTADPKEAPSNNCKNEEHPEVSSPKTEGQNTADIQEFVSEVTDHRSYDNVFEQFNTARYEDSSEMSVKNLTGSNEFSQHSDVIQLKDVPNTDPIKQIVDILNFSQHESPRDGEKLPHQEFNNEIDLLPIQVLNTDIVNLTQEFGSDIHTCSQELNDFENGVHPILDKGNLHIQHISDDRKNQNILPTSVITLDANQQSVSLSLEPETNNPLKGGHTHSDNQIKYPPTCSKNSILNVSDLKAILDIDMSELPKGSTSTPVEDVGLVVPKRKKVLPINVDDAKNKEQFVSDKRFCDVGMEMSYIQTHTSPPTSLETFSISEKTNTNVDNLTELSVSTKLLGSATKDSVTSFSNDEFLAITSNDTVVSALNEELAITSMDSVPSSAPKEINTSSHRQTSCSDARKSTAPKRTKIEKTMERRKPSKAMVRNPNISLAAFIHERLLTKEKASTSSHLSDRKTIDDNKEKTEVQFNALEAEKSLGLGLVDYSSSDDEKEGSSSDDNDCESSKVVGTDNVPSSSKPRLDEWNSTQYPTDNGNGNNVYTFHCITDTPQPQPVLKLNSALYSHSVFMPSNSSSTTGDLKQMLETHSVRIENAGRNGHFQLLEEKGCHSNTGFNGLDKKTDMTKSLKTLHCEIIVHMSEVDQDNDPHSLRDCSDVADSNTALITEPSEMEPMCNILSREQENLSLWRSQSPGVSESNEYAKREFQSLESTPDRSPECKRIVSQNVLMSTPVDEDVRMSQNQNVCGFNKHDDVSQHLSNNDDNDLKTCPSPRDNPTEPFHITEDNDDEVKPAEVVVQILDQTFIDNNKSSFIPVYEEPIGKNDIAEVEKKIFESKCKDVLKSYQNLTQNNEMSTDEDTTKLPEENSCLAIEKSEQDTKHFDYFFEDEVKLLSPCTGITTEKSEDETPKKCMSAYRSVDFTNYNEGQLQSSDGEDFSDICSTSALPNETTLNGQIINDTLGNVIVDVNCESIGSNNVAAVSAIKDSENLKTLATEAEIQDLTSQDTHFPARSNTVITGCQIETDYLEEQVSEAAESSSDCNEGKTDEEHYYSDIFKNETCDKNQQSLHQTRQANQDAPFNETESLSEVVVGASEEANDKQASLIKGLSGDENNVREVGDCCSQSGSEAVTGYQIEEEIKRGNPLSEESERHGCKQKSGLEMDINNKISESGDQMSDTLKRRRGHQMSPETECCNKMQTEEGTPHSNTCSLVHHSFNSYSSVKLSGDLSVSSADNCKKTLSSPMKPFKEDDNDKSSTSSDPDEDFDLIIENDTSSRNLISFKSSPEKNVFPKTPSTVGDIKPVKRILTKAFAHTHTAAKKNEYQKVILAKKPLRKTSQEQFKWDDDEESKTPGPITGHLTFTIGTNDAVKISMVNDHVTNDNNVQKPGGKRKVLQEKTETSPFISSIEDSSFGKTESKLKVTASISQSVSVVGGKPKRLIQKKRSYSPSDHTTPEIQAKIKKTNSANKQNRTSNPCIQKRSGVDKLIVNKRETVEFVYKGAEDLASANNNSIAVDDEISFKKDSFSSPAFEPHNCLPSISTALTTGGQQRIKAKSHKSSLSGTAHVISIPLEVKGIANNIHTNEEALHKTPIGLRSRHSSVESNKSDRSSSSKRQTEGNSQTAAKRGRKSEDSPTPMWQKIGLIKITPNTPNVASCAENAPMTRSSEAAMKAYNQKSLRNREVNPLDSVSASSPTLKGGQTNVSSRSLLDKGKSLVISKMAHVSSSAKHSPVSQPKSVGAAKISKRLNDMSPLAAVVKRRVAPVPSRQSQVKTSVKGTRPVTTSATVYVVDPVPNTPSSEISKKSSFVGARTIHTQLPSGTVIKPNKSVRHQNLSILKGTKADAVKRHRRKT